MDSLNPWTLIAIVVAGVVTLLVGLSIAEARNKAAGQLMSVCAGTESEIAAVITCGTGALIWLAIPGAIGIFIIVFSNLK